MDKKQAMAILHLSGRATRQDAKTAFRRLAKLHHPDHFAQDACAAIQAEKQMKAINQAYHLLKSLLPQGAEKTSPVRDMPEKIRSSGFADMVNRMKKTFWKKPGQARSAGPAGGSRPHVPPGCSSSPIRGSAKINRAPGQGTSFEQVFKPLFSGTGPKAASGQGAGTGTGHGAGTGKRSAARLQRPYAGFVRYMALKNRIQSRTRLQDPNNSTKVEKISRIRPVGRVARD